MRGVVSKRHCKISTRKTRHCPNASSLGRHRAGVGDFIVYREPHLDGGYTRRYARVLGTVSAPAEGSGEYRAPEVTDHLLVLTLSDNLGACFERWVDPMDVLEIGPPPTALAAFFFAPKLPYDAATLVRLGDYGSLSDHYIGGTPERVAHWQAQAKEAKRASRKH